MSSASEASPGRKRMLGAAAVFTTTCASAMIGLSGPALAAPDLHVPAAGVERPSILSQFDRKDPIPAQATANRGVAAPAPQLPPPAPVVSVGLRIVEAAASKAGTPYRYGGTGNGGYDCSGLTQSAYRSAGIEIPRTSSQQAAASRKISASEALPGDLVYFGSGGGVYHVGIYAGGNMMWHSPQTGDVVKLAPIYSKNHGFGRLW